MTNVRPFVPHGIPVDDRRPATPDEIAECKRLAREGASALHARAAVTKPPQLTDAEHAAIARKRIDNGGAR